MASGGVIFLLERMMRIEPAVKRAHAFFDGQNLFYHAKAAFGYSYPNYDPKKLAEKVCQKFGWRLDAVQFYTGVPDANDKPFWNHFWTAKMAVMGTRGIKTFSRPLRYRNRTIVTSSTAQPIVACVGQEKGIDVRIALDVVRLALDNAYDVAIIFSQDQDLSEAVQDVLRLSARDNRWIKIACAYPFSPAIAKPRGINGTDWIPLDRAFYEECLDPNDYRPPTTH